MYILEDLHEKIIVKEYEEAAGAINFAGLIKVLKYNKDLRNVNVYLGHPDYVWFASKRNTKITDISKLGEALYGRGQ